MHQKIGKALSNFFIYKLYFYYYYLLIYKQKSENRGTSGNIYAKKLSEATSTNQQIDKKSTTVLKT